MKHFLSTALFLTISFGVSSLQAAPLYWDPNATTGTAPGGTGNWDLTDSFWYDGTVDKIWPNASDDAFFTGTAGIVTLTTSISAGNLFFTNTTGSYLLTNATGAEVLTLANGIIDDGGSDNVVAVPIGGSTQITKSGAGRVHFTSDSSISYTGTQVLLTNGFASAENTNGFFSVNTTVSIADGAALEFKAGALPITNFSSAIVTGTGPAGSGVIDSLSGTTFFEGAVTLTTNATFGIDLGTLEYDNGINGDGSDLNVNIVGTNSSGILRLTAGGFNIGNNGTLTVNCAGTFQLNQSAAYTSTYSNLVVTKGFFELGGQEANLGNVPSSLITNQIYLNGGGLSSSLTAFVLNTKRGITIGPNGGNITVVSGNITTCGIYSDNVPVTFNCTGGNSTDLTLGAPLHLGTAGYTKNGPMTMNLNGQANIVGSITVNGGNLSWTANTTPLGPVPSSYVSNWWTLNGGNMNPSNTQTNEANRGIYLGTSGGGIGENTSSGNLTIASVITGPGALTKLTSGANSSVILTANNTFTGKVTVQNYNLKIGSGGSTGTLGNGNSVVLGAATADVTFNRSDAAYSYGGVISGSGTVTNNGSGTITLTGANTYTGGTTLNAGKFFANNSSGSGTGTGAVTVQNNATLGGTGSVGGAVTINAGGTLTPGTPSTPLGKLTINNNLTLVGNLAFSVNRTSQTNSLVVVTGTLSNTGTTNRITVTNLGPPLVAGDKFFLFNKAISGGNTLQITGASGVTWNNNLAVDGSIVVAAPSPTPVVNGFSLSGTNLTLSGTNGYSNGGFYVLSSTNLSLAVSSWTRVSTNTFDGSGNFSITNHLTTNSQRFYLLELR